MKIREIKIFKIGYYALLAILISLALLFIGSMIPIPGNYKMMTVLSGSMEPIIKTGSIVVSKSFDNYKIGEIITFESNEGGKIPTTHRIVEMEVQEGDPIYTTQGDANNAPDREDVRNKQIIGRVVLNIPFLGYAVNFVKKPIGFLLIIIIPAGIIILDEVKKIFKEVKKEKSKEKSVEKESTNQDE